MSIGTLTVIMMVALGVTTILFSVPGARPVLGGIGAAYILYLAWKVATAPPIGALQPTAAPPPLIGGYTMAVANPKAWAAFTALFSGFPLIADDPVTGGIVKVAILCCLPPAINLTWMTAGAKLAGLVRDPATGQWLNRGFAAVLVISVGLAFLI